MYSAAPWEDYYYGPSSYGRYMHRRPPPPNTKAGKPSRFCPACGLIHNDQRLVCCRNPACGAALTPPAPGPPGQFGKNGGRPPAAGQGQPKPPTTNGNAKNAANRNNGNGNSGNTIKPLPPSQKPVGGGLLRGELDSLLAIEARQRRQQELDDQGIWPAAQARDGEKPALSPEEAALIAKYKKNLAMLQGLPVEEQDTDSINLLESKLRKLVGKQPTPLGEQREAAKVTHYLGKLRTAYAHDKEACHAESKAAQTALEEAQQRVAKAAEWEASIDKAFHAREVRIQSILTNCSGDAPPTVHLPTAPMSLALPVEILSPLLSAQVQQGRDELGLGVETKELKAIEAFAARLVST